MALKFSIDPATGVVRPPVTVMNGGDVHHSKRSVSNRSVTVFNGGKRKSRKSKKSRKARKTIRKKSRKMKGGNGGAINITPYKYQKMSPEEQEKWISTMTDEQRTIWDTAVTKAKQEMETIPSWVKDETMELYIQARIYNEILAEQKKQKNYNALSNEEKAKIDKERELRIKVRQEVEKKIAEIPYIYLTKEVEDQIYKNTYNELKKQQ